MEKMDEQLIQKALVLSRKFIQKYCPQELAFFERVSKIMEETLLELKDIHPDDWVVEEPTKAFTRELGMSDDAAFLNLLSPKIMMIISATLIDMNKSSNKPLKQKILESIEHYGEKFKLPSKFRESLEEHLPNMISDIIEKTKDPQKSPSKNYVLLIDGTCHRDLTKAEADKLAGQIQSDKKYVVRGKDYSFLYFRNIPLDFNRKNIPIRMLVYFCMSKGKTVEMPALYDFAWECKHGAKKLNNSDEKCSAVYKQRFILSEMVKRDLDHFMTSEDEAHLSRGQYKVKNTLTSCLILAKDFSETSEWLDILKVCEAGTQTQAD